MPYLFAYTIHNKEGRAMKVSVCLLDMFLIEKEREA